jgi:hypothetical protein
MAPQATADVLREAVRAKLVAALDVKGKPHRWHVYARRDMNRLPTDEYPAVYVVGMAEQVLEDESDNRQLVAYPIAVALLFMEPIADRANEAPLIGLRRVCQQAVYTTQYAAPVPAVEWVTLQESVPLPLPGMDVGVTATAFGVTLGVLEQRSGAESMPVVSDGEEFATKRDRQQKKSKGGML